MPFLPPSQQRQSTEGNPLNKQHLSNNGFNLPGFTFLVPAHPGGPGHILEEQ